jgi:D-arabinose 1-dehydrogenase-like Zn-dependent alcohol dehydrogenase
LGPTTSAWRNASSPSSRRLCPHSFRRWRICGSDMHCFSHGRMGNFIATPPTRWCGYCPRCKEGRRNPCESIYVMGTASQTRHMQGGFASLFDAMVSSIVKRNAAGG